MKMIGAVVTTQVEQFKTVRGVIVNTFRHRDGWWAVIYVEPETYLVRADGAYKIVGAKA